MSKQFNLSNRKVWFNGSIVHIDDAKVNILTPSFQFGANVFEGIRAYWNLEKEQLYAFRLSDHYDRLLNSIHLFQIESTYTKKIFFKAFVDSVKANNFKEDIAIRHTVFVDGKGNWASQGPAGMFVSPIPQGRTLQNGKIGFNCTISSYQRINDNNLSPRIKVGANYINGRYAQLQAKANGYDTTLFLNSDGKISEGPGSSFFMIKEGALVTPLLTDSILDSITRKTIIEIASNYLGVKVIERRIDRTELFLSDGLFLCGSAMEIVPIIKVDQFIINDNKISPLLDKLITTYFDIVRGKLSQYNHWLTPIY
jgi:branched-chain amino acid aminotransferase